MRTAPEVRDHEPNDPPSWELIAQAVAKSSELEFVTPDELAEALKVCCLKEGGGSMLDARLPHVDEVGGDLLSAAQPMLQLGWDAPAVATARIAFDRGIEDILFSHELAERHKRLCLRAKLDRIEDAGLLRRRHRKYLVGLYVSASRSAHGHAASLHDSMTLIESIAEVCADLTAIAKGGQPC